MENLTEARCAVEGCGHLKSEHSMDGDFCYACSFATWTHEFILAAAHVKQEKPEELER